MRFLLGPEDFEDEYYEDYEEEDYEGDYEEDLDDYDE